MISNTVKNNIRVNSTDSLSRNCFESLSNFIKVSDIDEKTGLTNFCYVNDLKTDSDEFLNNNVEIKKCRGVVFDGENIVMNGFSFTEEYSINELSTTISDTFSSIGKGCINKGVAMCQVYEAHEGTLIRMFNFKGVWFTSTNRKLNAFKSSCGSNESYGCMFKAALKYQINVNDALKKSIPETNGNFYDAFQKNLDPSNQYMFLVRNTNDNRLVSKAPDNPTMFHVGTFVNGELDMDIDINVYKPRRIDLKTIDEIHNYVNSIHPSDSSGVIVFCPNNIQFKISSIDHLDMIKVRGEQSSVKFRYLQVRMSKQYNNSLRMMYPSEVNEFDFYEQILHDISRKIHTAYMDRFIHKKFISIPKDDYSIIRTAHGWFLEDRGNHVVTYDVIRCIINERPPSSLNRMIKKYKHDLVVQEKENEKQRRYKQKNERYYEYEYDYDETELEREMREDREYELGKESRKEERSIERQCRRY